MALHLVRQPAVLAAILEQHTRRQARPELRHRRLEVVQELPLVVSLELRERVARVAITSDECRVQLSMVVMQHLGLDAVAEFNGINVIEQPCRCRRRGRGSGSITATIPLLRQGLERDTAHERVNDVRHAGRVGRTPLVVDHCHVVAVAVGVGVATMRWLSSEEEVRHLAVAVYESASAPCGRAGHPSHVIAQPRHVLMVLASIERHSHRVERVEQLIEHRRYRIELDRRSKTLSPPCSLRQRAIDELDAVPEEGVEASEPCDEMAHVGDARQQRHLMVLVVTQMLEHHQIPSIKHTTLVIIAVFSIIVQYRRHRRGTIGASRLRPRSIQQHCSRHANALCTKRLDRPSRVEAVLVLERPHADQPLVSALGYPRTQAWHMNKLRHESRCRRGAVIAITMSHTNQRDT